MQANTLEAPHAIETFFTPTEQETMQSLQQAKQTLRNAYMTNPMVNSIINTCQGAGLFELDQLRVLCANLLTQHNQASQALINMDNKIKELEATRYGKVQRRMFESWRGANDTLYARCDDGTVWKFAHDRHRAPALDNPRWEYMVEMSAMIPQGV